MDIEDITYPRRRLSRALLRKIIALAFFTICDFNIQGRENFPAAGPLLIVANHFSFLDPVAVARVVPWPMEFLGGAQVPNAPAGIAWLRNLWGYYPVYRGTGSRFALRAAETILHQNGIIGIFPEGSSAIDLLRPARPGASFIASRTQSRILPIGLDGFTQVFPSLRRGKRARVTVRIGQPLGPYPVRHQKGRKRREKLESISHKIMEGIAALLPPERRGLYSDDPAIRAAVREAAVYPWDTHPET